MLGLVGESGSGKTTVGLACSVTSRRGVTIAGGTITGRRARCPRLDDVGAARAARQARQLRPAGSVAALNPALRIGKQLLEVMEFHGFGGNDEARRERVVEVMSEVLLPGTPDFLRRYPHQLSGGQQQRVGLAMAFACRPSVIVLDEPTTGLDVSTQAYVLDTVRDLCRQHGVAALYVTHDLAVVANLADRVAVMYAGRIVEEGPTAEIFAKPSHPYTRYLIAAAPDMSGDQAIVGLRGRAPAPGSATGRVLLRPPLRARRRRLPRGLATADRGRAGHTVPCVGPVAVPDRIEQATVVTETPTHAASDAALSLRDVCASYTGVQVVHDVTFDVDRGECVALVGESGSGKSTLSKSIGGLHHEWTGEILLAGRAMANAARDRSTKERLSIQYVFQNPYSRCTHGGPSATRSPGRWRSAAPAGEAAGRSARCSSGCRSPPPTRTGTPTSSAAASVSASRSHARS